MTAARIFKKKYIDRIAILLFITFCEPAFAAGECQFDKSISSEINLFSKNDSPFEVISKLILNNNNRNVIVSFLPVNVLDKNFSAIIKSVNYQEFIENFWHRNHNNIYLKEWINRPIKLRPITNWDKSYSSDIYVSNIKTNVVADNINWRGGDFEAVFSFFDGDPYYLLERLKNGKDIFYHNHHGRDFAESSHLKSIHLNFAASKGQDIVPPVLADEIRSCATRIFENLYEEYGDSINSNIKGDENINKITLIFESSKYQYKVIYQETKKGNYGSYIDFEALAVVPQ